MADTREYADAEGIRKAHNDVFDDIVAKVSPRRSVRVQRACLCRRAHL